MAITAFLLLTCGKIQPVSPAHMDGRGNATRATFHSSYFMWDNISPTLNRISHDGKPDMKHKMSQKTLNITWHFRKCVIKQNWMKDDINLNVLENRYCARCPHYEFYKRQFRKGSPQKTFQVAWNFNRSADTRNTVAYRFLESRFTGCW